MTTYINDNVAPGSAVVFILARWGSTYASGTGFIVGNNDILTASHVIYSSSLGRLADEIFVYPSFDPNANNNKRYSPVWIEYFPNFDPDGDGYVYLGDSSYNTFAGSEIDIALLVMKEDLRTEYGYFSIDPKYLGGAASVIGYPGKYDYRLTGDDGSIQYSAIDSTFLINSDLEVNPGNSGGPIYYKDKSSLYQAVGIVSTGIGAVNLAAHYQWLSKSMLAGDRYLFAAKPTPVYEVVTNGISSIKEGETARFQIKTKNIPGFTELKYQISGVQLQDITLSSLTGSFTINSEGLGFVDVPTIIDSLNESTEVLRLTVNGFSAQINVENQTQSTTLSILSFATTKIGARTPAKPVLYLNFNESFTIGSGIIELRLGSSSGPIVEIIDKNSISYEGTPSLSRGGFVQTLIIKPRQSLASDEIYYAVANPGVVVNERGQTFKEVYSAVFYTEKLDIKVNGTMLSEELWGSSGSDTIYGFAGDDKIYGGPILSDSGNDLIFGGDGSDSISGNGGSDTIFGEGGNDLISGFEGYFDGGSGWDAFDLSHVFARDLKLSFSPNGVTVYRYLAYNKSTVKYELVNFEALSISPHAIRIDTKQHGSYADLPDTLYQFFITAFGGAPGVTYMDQMAEAFRYWLPEYKGETVRQIVEVFTTKQQFTSLYPQALYRESGGKYYLYSHDGQQPGNPLVNKGEITKDVYDSQMNSLATALVDRVIKSSASVATKSSAIIDVRNALMLGGEWTIGKVIYTIFGNLAAKSTFDSVWGGTAKQFANQVAVAKYYTDVLSQSTDDISTLRSVVNAVNDGTDVSSSEAIATLIGVSLLNGSGG